MMLYDAVEVDQVPVDVVEHLDIRGCLGEVQGRSACEHLDVTGVGGEAAEYRIGLAPLTPYPGNDRFRHCEPLFLLLGCPSHVAGGALPGLQWYFTVDQGLEVCSTTHPVAPLFLITRPPSPSPRRDQRGRRSSAGLG